jgi:hypothetical protein
LSHTQQQPESLHGRETPLLLVCLTPKPASTTSALAYPNINTNNFRRTAHSFSLALEGNGDWWGKWL